jgi:hypothetical protein
VAQGLSAAPPVPLVIVTGVFTVEFKGYIPPDAVDPINRSRAARKVCGDTIVVTGRRLTPRWYHPLGGNPPRHAYG